VHNRQKSSELQSTIGFSEFDIFESCRQSFPVSKPCTIYGLLPFEQSAKPLGLKGRSLGKASCFTLEGKIALMLLKSYSCSPDKDLIAQHNANIYYLLFCRVRINPLDLLATLIL
jgi:hypothetical protein